MTVATLDPFHGHKHAIDDKLADATSVVDPFHIVKLGTAVVDDVRRRVQQGTTARIPSVDATPDRRCFVDVDSR